MTPAIRSAPPVVHARLATAAALALALAAVPARAGDGAGTRSIFASGAGSRPLAMGGAYAAVADGANALWWNPAGLGLASRAGLEAAHASSALGFDETWAALVLPSWGWGAAGISVHHFGTGGIERRDDRNVLLASDLSDAETEIAVGYGRRLGEAWTLGGSVKLQHQSLAGASASGLGLDLGLQVRPFHALGSRAPWASGPRVGLALRNAVEPSLRLDRESVADPMVARGGIGWDAPLGRWGGLVTGLDFESGPAADSRVRAGLELRLLADAALRMGWNGDALTAGAGFAWRDLGVEYAIESGALETAHRVGVTLGFGSTVSEARLAARRAEDAAIEKRLGEAFRERQDEQLRALLARVREARASGRCDEALDALAVITTLEPGHPEARSLEAGCLADRARGFESRQEFAAAAIVWDEVLQVSPGDSAAASAARRCRDDSDRRAKRTAERRRGFAAAMDAFAVGDLRAARDGFSALLGSDPADADARGMLARTDQAMAARAGALVQQARVLGRAGLLDEAQAAIERARSLAPGAPGLSAAAADLQRLRQVARARQPAAADSAPARPAPLAVAAPVLSDQELETLYRRAAEAHGARRTDDALRYWELVWSARPGYREVGAHLEREYLTRGMEAFAAGRLEEAVGQWERVLRVDPGDARARGYLSRAHQQLARSREILGVSR